MKRSPKKPTTPHQRAMELARKYAKLLVDRARLLKRKGLLETASAMHKGNPVASYHRDLRVCTRKLEIINSDARCLLMELTQLHHLDTQLTPPM